MLKSTYDQGGNACSIERQRSGPFGSIELPSFKITPHGVRCRFPLAEVEGITIAVLLCQSADQHYGLLLHPAQDEELQDPSRRTYYVSWSFKSSTVILPYRIAELGNDLYNLRFRGKPVVATWRDINICASPPLDSSLEPAHLILRFIPDCLSLVPFRVPRWLIGVLRSLDFFPLSSYDPPRPHGTLSSSLHTHQSSKVFASRSDSARSQSPRPARDRLAQPLLALSQDSTGRVRGQ